MKKYIVTGGAGFIGKNACSFLLQQDDVSVTVVDLKISDDVRQLLQGATFVEADIRDTQKLQQIFTDADVVIHLAAVVSQQWTMEHPAEAHDINVNGTLAVLEAARAAGVKRIVYGSSAMVYGDQEVALLNEDLQLKPQTPYGLHKLIGEQMMRLWSELYGIETLSLRLLSTYGPHYDVHGPYPLVIGTFLNLRKQDKPLTITGDGNQSRDFVHASDVARAIYKASSTKMVGTGEIINIGTGVSTSVKRIAELIGGPVEYISARIEPKNTCADITKAKQLLDWEPSVAIEEGIAQLQKEQT